MTHSDHLAEDVLSALVDDQLSPAETAVAETHLHGCSTCRMHLAQTRELVGMVRSLPGLEPPRDFRLGLRLVQDPPNVVRLRRWYAWSRAGAGALAAAFVFLSAGTLYIDSRSAAAPATLAVNPPSAARDAAAAVSARALAPQAAPPGPAPAGTAVAAPAAALRAQPGATPAGGESADQVAAATTVRPLPTQVPTATPASRVSATALTATTSQIDLATPLRLAAVLLGGLAILALLGVLYLRHRLKAVSPVPQE